jgi:hypothetical protein
MHPRESCGLCFRAEAVKCRGGRLDLPGVLMLTETGMRAIIALCDMVAAVCDGRR